MEWITGKIYRTRISRAHTGRLSDISIEDCQALLGRVNEFYVPALNDAPHVLVHGDLQASNIIVNKDVDVEWCVLLVATPYQRN